MNIHLLFRYKRRECIKIKRFTFFFSVSFVSNISYKNDPNRHCQYIYPVFLCLRTAASLSFFVTNLKGEPMYLTSIWEASRFRLDLVHLFYTRISLLLHVCDSQSVSQPPRHHPLRRPTIPL